MAAVAAASDYRMEVESCDAATAATRKKVLKAAARAFI